MSLPVSLDKIIKGRSVEWERLEFKEGWNPLKTMQEVCGFANDFSNLNGGYIILGIEDEGGRPVLPPAGLLPERIDQIQRELRGKCKRIQPEYQPLIVPENYQGKNILVIWAPGGKQRPYQAPKSFSKGSDYAYFIRQGSCNVEARGQTLTELMQVTQKIPFDDIVNHAYGIDELDKQLMRQFLKKAGSELFEDFDDVSFETLCIQMQVADRVNAHLAPRNVGLLFFTPDPDEYFPTARIEVVHFRDEGGGDVFEEKEFLGSLDHQISQCLQYLKNTVIEERVIKHSDQAQAERFYNYPFPALEEIIVNAVYHRSYQEREPVEVSVFPDRIEVLSFPGPVRSVKMEDFKKGRVRARRYRNRRIGEFLKDVNLCEGRGTGVPKIRRSMAENGSPEPDFKTDDDRTYFLSILPVHTAFRKKDEGVTPQAAPQATPQAEELLEYCQTPRSRSEIQEFLDLKDRHYVQEQFLKPLISKGLLQKLNPDKPTSPKQKYVRTHTEADKVREQAARLTPQAFPQATPQAEKLLKYCKTPRSRSEIQEFLGLKDRHYLKDKFIDPLLHSGLLSRTIPDKPTSPKQKYVTTDRGVAAIER